MTLSEYRAKNRLTLAQLADLFGVPVTTLHGWISGRRRPALDQALEIERLTAGAVKCADLSMPSSQPDQAA